MQVDCSSPWLGGVFCIVTFCQSLSFFNLVGKLLMRPQFVNGNYYIDLKKICNHFNACTIYYFVLNLLLGKSGTGKMSKKMTVFDLVKNGFFKNPHPPENPRIRGLKSS
jgi:hypothetical protein